MLEALWMVIAVIGSIVVIPGMIVLRMLRKITRKLPVKLSKRHGRELLFIVQGKGVSNGKVDCQNARLGPQGNEMD